MRTLTVVICLLIAGAMFVWGFNVGYNQAMKPCETDMECEMQCGRLM
jgi:hypothetical protein